MRTQSLIRLAALLCAILVPVLAGGGGPGKFKEMMKKCKDSEINVDEAFKGFDECKAEFKQENDSGSESERRRRSPHGGKRKRGKGFMKNMCIQVCQWKKAKVLKSDGTLDTDGATDYVNSVYPEQFRAETIEEMKKCAEEHSSKFSMENQCKGYKGFKHCVIKAHMKTCGIEFPKGKGKGMGPGPSSEGEDE